jgi:putative ABC transport system permease protein
MIADLLPLRARIDIYLGPLATAGTFGLLVSLLFALLPLMPRADHLGSDPDARRGRRRPADRARRAGADRGGGVVLAGFTIYVAPERRTAGWFVLGAIGAFIAFPLLARGLMWAAARVGKPKFAALGWRSPISIGPVRRRRSSCCRSASASPCWWRRR